MRFQPTGILVFLLSPVALAAPMDASGMRAASSPQQVGKTIYNTNCVGCHGLTASGAVAPGIINYGQQPLNLLKRAVLQGKGADGRSLNLTMPRYTGGFRPQQGHAPTDTQLKNLQAYLKSMK